jgi:LAGLIDADG endonuclease
LLYAGTTSISFKYLIRNDIVKKLKQWSKSAGNSFISLNELFSINKIGTSETLRSEIVNTENIKPISVHVPTHLKPVNDIEFGHYLAGLIDGDGHFSSKQELVIVFNSLDASLAYYIKKQIGFGSIKKVKDKNAFILTITAIVGMEKVINLINGKIRTENKLNEINNNILNHEKYTELSKKLSFKINLNKDLKNHWLAGFSDALASFQIKYFCNSFNNKTQVRLNFQIDQKKDSILLLIKNFLGGSISYQKIKDSYQYNSSSFGSARNVIKYFDYFHLLSIKHVKYLKWRKTYSSSRLALSVFKNQIPGKP